MRIERELLKEFVDFVDSYEFYPTERSVIWEIVNRANAILAQPEQDNIQYLLDQVARLTAENAMLKEKWSAPTREPLGLEIMDVCGSEDYREGFKDGALYADKHYGIGGNNDN